MADLDPENTLVIETTQGKVVIAPRISMQELQETLRQEQMLGLLRDYYVSRLDMTAAA